MSLNKRSTLKARQGMTLFDSIKRELEGGNLRCSPGNVCHTRSMERIWELWHNFTAYIALAAVSRPVPCRWLSANR